MATGFVYHELYMWHENGNFAGFMPYGDPVQPYMHVEHQETKRRIRNLLEVSGLLKQLLPIEPRPASKEEICRVHTPGYYEKIQSQNDLYLSETGTLTPMGRGSFEIARLSAGGVIEAVDAVLDGKADNAYALVRPPGHHALADMGMGFCIFGNAAIAGRHLLEARRLKRIALVDWDVHHGNGTQAAFYDEPAALTISIHQHNCFPPDSGYIHERGEGKGEGFNINVPLPPGSGIGAYEAVYDRIVIPALQIYKPEFIIVPSGFDAGAQDPLARQMVTSSCYRSLTRKLLDVAADVCNGRLVMCHEGGYNAFTIPFFGLAVMEALSGIDTGVEDPFDLFLCEMGYQDLQPHQDAVIKEVEPLVQAIQQP
ncbi:MAG: class II histone deacetylase [Gammaproteobacteria bacterium]